MSGWGSGWGITPWGGALLPLATVTPPVAPTDFDIYCFYDDASSMGSILVSPYVSAGGDPAQYSINPSNNDLVVSSGGSYPDVDAWVYVDSAVPSTWTVQTVFELSAMPADFTSLSSCHFYVGGADDTGIAAGVLLSSAGIAYTGSAYLSGGSFVLDGPMQVLPDTAGAVQTGVSYTLRIAVDSVTSTTYLFLTPTEDVPYIGHTLLAVLPSITCGGSSAEGTLLSVRGPTSSPVVASIDQLCLGTGLIMPNVPPRADAGMDQSARMCSIVALDGTASADPDGGSVTYSWRLIDAPATSAFAFEGFDCVTYPLSSPTGFTNKVYSASLGDEAALDPISVGDVVLVGGYPYSVAATGADGLGFYVQTTTVSVPDSFGGVPFKLLRQRSISGLTTATPTFYPDVPGVYKFDLYVFDGVYPSTPSTTVVNVLESSVPKGITPDVGFLWSYLSDFWKLVEGRERIQTFWEGMTQVVASELLTLWQVDYNKSLRDIQRSFQRKWLHYDLKLPEPLPSASRVYVRTGGVVLGPISTVGVSGVQGSVLRVSSPAHPTLAVQFPQADPYTADKLALTLRAKLKGVDARYEVVVTTRSSGQQDLCVYAPFYFEVASGSTLPLVAVGLANTHAQGTNGTRLSPRVYLVDRSLQGVPVSPGDLLAVGGSAYKVVRVVDDPADQYRYQRVVVSSDLPLIPGSAWSLPSFVTSKLLDFYNGLVSYGDSAYVEVYDQSTNSTGVLKVDVEAACAQEPSTLAVNLTSVLPLLSDAVVAKLAYVLRRTYLPISNLVVDLPCLQERIKENDDSAVLRRNSDFFLCSYRGASAVRFVSGVTGGPSVWEGADPPPRLWAEITYLDNRPIIEGNFGIVADFTLDNLQELQSDLDYLSAVRGLWYAYMNGPTLKNLRVGTQILLGLPFSEEQGVIEEVRSDFSPNQGRILVRDVANTAVVRSYYFPRTLSLEVNPATGVAYAVGDRVEQLAPLVQGAEVIDYVKDPTWFEGILNQGNFFEVEKFHKFLVRVDSSAFSLSSILFVQSFIRRIKPTYTIPMLVVRRRVAETDVDVTDEVTFSGKLTLNESPCGSINPVATCFDDYRAAGGAVWNQYDTNNVLSDPLPVFPTPDSPVQWGFDKNYTCPEDTYYRETRYRHSGGVPAYDSSFLFDAPSNVVFESETTEITSVPAGPTGLLLPSPVTLPDVVDVTEMQLILNGTLGPDPGDYTFVVALDGVDTESINVTLPEYGYVGRLEFKLIVPAGAAVTIRVVPSSGGARSPYWRYLYVALWSGEAYITFDTPLPPGTYCVASSS